MKNSMEVLQKIKNRVTMCPSNLSSGYLPKKLENFYSKDICIPMFIAPLFKVAKTWRKQESFNRGLGKEDVVHIYYGSLLSH